MSEVMTARGPVDGGLLGFTDMHTHVLSQLDPEVEFEWPANSPPEQPTQHETGLEISLENLYELRRGHWSSAEGNRDVHQPELVEPELALFTALGGKTLVDASPIGLRVDPRAYERLSENLDVNIVVSTGLYAESFWPKRFLEMKESELAALMVHEIEEGIDGSEIRAGHIKIGCNRLSERETRALRAGARAAIETGIMLQVHTGGAFLSPTDTLQMASILVDEGVNLERVLFAHMDQFVMQTDLKRYITNHEKASALQLETIQQVLDTGANIGFDCFGVHENKEINYYIQASDYDRMAALFTLITRGYSGQITLGTDVGQRLYYRRNGGAGYGRILDFVVPTLQALEVSERDLANLTHRNAARLLGKATPG